MEILDIVGELKAVESSNDEDEPSEEEDAAQINGDDSCLLDLLEGNRRWR